MDGARGANVARVILARDGAGLDARGRALAEEGRLALPAADAHDDEPFLPRAPRIARCRLCGEQRQLTREHVPPGAAFNRERGRAHRLEDWLARDDNDVLAGGVIEQGGIWAYTLCERCNNLTGHRYAEEYRMWAYAAMNMLADAGVNVRDLDATPEPPRGVFELGGDPGPQPGAFAREVLALMCSVSAGFDLAGRYPAVRRIVLDGAEEPLPAGMTIGLSLFLESGSRLSGPQLVVSRAAEEWRWVMEVAHPPFACLMVLASNRDPAHTFDLSPFTQVGAEERQVVAGRLDIGFGHTPLPGDYRTQAAIVAEAAT
jgi:hypothetical protein